MKIWKDENDIKVAIGYDSDMVEKLKLVGSGKWNKKSRLWSFPFSKYDDLIELKNYKVEDISNNIRFMNGNELVCNDKIGNSGITVLLSILFYNIAVFFFWKLYTRKHNNNL